MRPILSFFTFSVAVILLISQSAFSQLTCVDSALNFSGNNQYVKLSPNDASTGNFLSTLTGDYTIECLIKWNGGADFQRIFDFSYGGGYFMFLTTSENQNHVPRFAISTTGLSSPEIIDANIPLVPGVYHHIAITYSKAADSVHIFIDGIPAGAGFADIAASEIYTGTDAHDSSANYIGLSSFAGDPQLSGNIDEFRISNNVRYTSVFVPSVPFVNDESTITLYHFDNGSGSIATDASGNGYDAELGSTLGADDNDPTWFSCSGVLATSLLNFTATQNKGNVQLSWKADNGSNTDYFLVERSTNGSDFTTVQKVSATANIYNYTFTDTHAAAGTNYYRLQQVDKSGSFKYSSIIVVKINGNGGFKIYPTIVTNHLHVTTVQIPSTLIIYNTAGSAVKKINVNNTEQDIDVSGLNKGTYIIRNITTSNSLKFIKQ